MLAALAITTQLPKSTSLIKPGDLSTPHSQILASTRETDRCASCHDDRLFRGPAFLSSHKELRTQTQRCLDCHHTTMPRDTAKFAHNLPSDLRDSIRLASLERQTLSRNSLSPGSWHDSLPQPAVNQEDIECSACHREHQGAMHDLTALSDAQCQTCHHDRFGSFADAHPEFGLWPYEDNTKSLRSQNTARPIDFDHRSHATKHYPQSSKLGSPETFDCNSCHQVNLLGVVSRSVNYEIACSRCHDNALQTEITDGIELASLPSLDSSIVTDSGTWPEAATGFLDGKISPFAQLLIRESDEMSRAIATVPEQDFSRINPSDAVQMASAESIAVAIHDLLNEIAERGQSGLRERLIKAGLPTASVDKLIRTFPPQLVETGLDQWFQAEVTGRMQTRMIPSDQDGVRTVQFQLPGADLLLEEDLLAEPSEGADALLEGAPVKNSLRDPLRSDDLNSGESSDLLGDEGLLDDEMLDADLLTDRLASDDALTDDYGDELLSREALEDDALDNSAWGNDALVGGSSDVKISTPRKKSRRFDAQSMLVSGGWYRDDLRFALRYRAAGHADPVLTALIELAASLQSNDPLANRVLENKTVAACVRCHPGAANRPGNWNSINRIGRRDQFTKFSHGPHLNIASLANCTACHQVVDSDLSGDEKHANWISAVTGRSTPQAEMHNHEFAPIQKSDCATCHIRNAAGDSCVKCHRYHIDLGWESLQ